MQKILAGFLLTLRWLLVLLLPMLGLIFGEWLMPEPKPVWTYSVGTPIQSLGYMADGDTTTFQIALWLPSNPPGESTKQVIGLDQDTGIPHFTTPIARGRLIPGTTFLFYHDYLAEKQEDVLFDWKTQKEMVRFDLGKPLGNFTTCRSAGDTLVFLARGDAEVSLVSWKRGTAQPVCVQSDQPDSLGNTPFKDVQLRPDGHLVILLCDKSSPEGSSNSEDHFIRIIDLESGNVVQTLTKIKCVHWHIDHDGFLALIDDYKQGSLAWQNYRREGQRYIEFGPKTPIPYAEVYHFVPSRWIIMNSSNSDNPICFRIKHRYGAWAEQLVNRFWPEASIYHLYHPENGELERSWTLPGISRLHSLNMMPYPRPDGMGMIMHDHIKHTLSYWEFYPAARWYPRLGIVLGIMLAILLAWRNLRRTMEVKPIHA